MESGKQGDIYLDNATTSFPKPDAVYRAVDAFARSCGVSPGRGGHPAALEAAEMLSRCRTAVARLLGASDPSRVAFASGSTEALNWALRGLLLREGDHAVVTALEHNAVLRPLAALGRQRGVAWTVVPCDAKGDVDPAAVERAIVRETKLVCVVHASNVLGTVAPIREIARVAHARGVPVLVDGSQAAGAYPLSVEEDGVDLYAFTGHKSLLGPPGTGGLYVRPGLAIETSKEGGTGTRSESLTPPVEMPECLEVGTPNAWGMAGLLAGVEHVAAAGVPATRAREMELFTRMVRGLEEIPGVRLFGHREQERRIAILSLNIGTLPPAEVGRLLGERYGIAVRTGLHCAPLTHDAIGTARTGGTVRFGIGPLNAESDIDAAITALRQIAAAAFRKRRVA